MQRLLLSFWFVLGVLGEPIVESDLGRIRGKIREVQEVDVETFFGIPYAKPPVGDLRFALPEAFGAVGELDATDYAATCPQPNNPLMEWDKRRQDEDCLYLNVYRKQGTSKTDRKAVVATIHGGGFVVGSSAEALQNPASLAAFGDVIVVGFNYRLGILGFANMGDFAPGNLGLHDQRLALQWIQDHIADFGGDPNQVTVIGVSAGSMSLAAQIITPTDDKNLFQSAVLDAGVVASNGFFEDSLSSYTRLKKIAAQVGCPVDSQEMVDCLRKASVDELLPLSFNTTGTNGIRYFVAAADGKFIPHDVEDYVEKNSATIRKVRSIIGYAKDEGTFFVSGTFLGFDIPTPKTEEELLEHFAELSTNYNHRLDLTDEKTRNSVAELYANEFPGDPFHAIAAFQGDGIFKCPVNKFVRSLARHNDEVYVYQFDRELRSTYWKILSSKPSGAFHFSPYLHFVGVLLTSQEAIEPQDKLFSLDSINMISSFAKRQDPPTFRNLKWPSFSESGEVMILNETPSLRRGLSSERNCRELFDAVRASPRSPKNEL